MANKYVRAGASGGGTNWTNAYGSLPATLTRGDTYYIAEGYYGSYTFNTPESGATLVTIKKATISDHGTSTGWSDGYGDGAAEFGQIVVQKGYLLFDGQVGQWASDLPNYAPYGFKIRAPSAYVNQYIILLGQPGQHVNGVTFRHVDASFTSTTSWNHGSMVLWAYADNFTASYCWFHNSGQSTTKIEEGGNWLLEYCVIEQNGQAQIAMEGQPTWPAGADGEHSVLMMYNNYTSNHVLRHSVLRRFRSSGGFLLAGANHNCRFYGNVFTQGGAQYSGGGNGALNSYVTGAARIDGLKIYNNTFVDMPGGEAGKVCSIGIFHSDLEIKNNIFCNVVGLQVNSTGRTHNYYNNVGSTFSETSVQNASGDPFVNRAGFDLRLTANTTAGTNLGNSYNVDPLGNTRTTWTRGAYEFVSATTPIISVSPSSLNFGSTSVGNSVDRLPSVTNTGGGTLSGTVVTTSPYSIVSGTPYNLAAGQSQDVTVRFTPTATGTVAGTLNFNGSPGTSIPMTGAGAGILGLEFDADEGTIEAPFAIDGSGNVSQSIDTQGDVAAGGRATYTFNAPAGNYSILVSVNAPNPAENSFYVNIDAEPTEPTMTWDVVQTTTGFEDRSVYWRGTGTFDDPEFQPKVFTLTAGVHQLIIVGREANAALAHITFILVSPVSIIPATPPSGAVNTPYSFQFNATGGQPPYTWSNDPGSYPPGITLSSTTGLLSGTPTQDGTFSWSIRAEDANNEEASLAISVVIDPEVIPISVTTTLIPDATADVAYSYTLQATGGTLPYTWTLTGGELPPGLSLASSGEISGTSPPTVPPSDSIYLLAVTVEDADSNTDSSGNLTIIVWGGLDSVPAIISVI